MSEMMSLGRTEAMYISDGMGRALCTFSCGGGSHDMTFGGSAYVRRCHTVLHEMNDSDFIRVQISAIDWSMAGQSKREVLLDECQITAAHVRTPRDTNYDVDQEQYQVSARAKKEEEEAELFERGDLKINAWWVWNDSLVGGPQGLRNQHWVSSSGDEWDGPFAASWQVFPTDLAAFFQDPDPYTFVDLVGETYSDGETETHEETGWGTEMIRKYGEEHRPYLQQRHTHPAPSDPQPSLI
jgi:hypothetical protein